uniref:Protein toll n=1 Tax=Cacopsylla melanoneura TaxID=428564 RepID=A0A8D8TQT3_9HEMI
MGTRTLVCLVLASLLLVNEQSAFEILTNCQDCWCVDTCEEFKDCTTLCFHKEKHPDPETISDESIDKYYDNTYDFNDNKDDYHEFNAIPNLQLRRFRTLLLEQISCSRMSSADMSTLNTTLNNLIPKLGFQNVIELHLKNCPIPDESFQTLFRLLNGTSVQKLWVSGSQSNITLSSAYFENLSLQTILFEDSVGLRRLHQDLFKGTPELVFLGLNRNNITTLDPGVFQGLRNLEFLYLNHNSITDLHADIFEHLTSLLDLEIINNRLVSLPRGLFRNCRKLERLDLHENALHTLEGPQFEFLSRLQLLDLRYNRLEKITDGMFNGTHDIVLLDLSHNKLNVISQTAFDILCRTNSELDAIYLSDNILEWNSNLVDSPFNECESITVLQLSNNRISYIHNDWIMGIQWLDLNGNNITILPDFNSFTSKSKDMTLDVSDNQIKTFKLDSVTRADADKLFKLTPNDFKLTQNESKRNMADDIFDKYGLHIVLDGNPITCDCSYYALVDYVYYFRKAQFSEPFKRQIIETEDVTCKPWNIPYLTGITYWNKEQNIPTNRFAILEELTCNKVDGCPSSCNCSHSPYHSQTTVNCSSANLERMPQELDVMYKNKTPQTIMLILRNNSIQQLLQNQSDNYKLVTDLDLSLNAIKDWKVDIVQDFPHLASLNLSHNHLESLSEDFINSLSKSNIRSLYLSGNPWKCGRDTSTERLCKFVFDNQHRFFNDFEEITCNGSNHTFKATKPKDFCATINISQVSNLIPVQKDSEQITLNGSNHPFNTTKPKDIYGTPKISYPTDTFDVQISLGILCVLFVLSIVFYYNKYQQKIKVCLVYRLFCKPGVSQ